MRYKEKDKTIMTKQKEHSLWLKNLIDTNTENKNTENNKIDYDNLERELLKLHSDLTYINNIEKNNRTRAIKNTSHSKEILISKITALEWFLEN